MTAADVRFRGKRPTEADFRRLSPAIEAHPFFPERTTVQWCVVETGSDACAVAVVGTLLGIVGGEVQVISRGARALPVEARVRPSTGDDSNRPLRHATVREPPSTA